jgi:hypothetical protein
MTAIAEQSIGTDGPEGLIFLPGIPEGIDVSGNPERDIANIEFAIMTGRGVFSRLRDNARATELVHVAFVVERARILGGAALVSSAEL